MRIGLVDVDGHNFPNLPLMKISAWYKRCGDEVNWYNHLLSGKQSIVYVSKVFDFTPDYPYTPDALRTYYGGTGYGSRRGCSGELPENIEHAYPDYDLYPDQTRDTAYGFLTRGCPRGCEFCIVGRKEGRVSHKVAGLNEFWRGQKNIKLLDPNLLACGDRDQLLDQLIDSNAWVDFTQGLDARLLTVRTTEKIKRIKTKMVHFAWDNISDEDHIIPNLKMFKAKTGLDRRKLGVYVLTNFGTTHEEDLHRVYTLKSIGYDPYIMIYDKANAPQQTRLLQRWCNNKIIFATTKTFEEYDPRKG